MPLLFPGSSEQTIKPPVASATVDKLAELSTDEPLPLAYHGDRIRLLPQSPRRLYLYWGLATDPFATLGRAFGTQAERYSLVARLVNTDSGEESLHLASPTNSQWIEVQPGISYRVDLGLLAPNRAFIKLLSSNVVQTPRTAVARSADISQEWHISAGDFARVLDEAGYVSDALEVTLEAADEATNDRATRAVAQRFTGAEVPLMTEEILGEMRSLLAALAFGAPFDGVHAVLSPPLASWVEQAGRQSNLTDGPRLFEILRSMLGLEMSGLSFNAPEEEAMRRAARVIVGASEVNLPTRPFHLWMPSMTPGRLRMIGTLSQ